MEKLLIWKKLVSKMSQYGSFLVIGREQNFRELSMNVIPFSPFAWNAKSMDDYFPHFLWFWVKNVSTSAWFHVKLLKLHESGMNENSRHRTEVNHVFVKCFGNTVHLSLAIFQKTSFIVLCLCWGFIHMYQSKQTKIGQIWKKQ